MKRKLTAGTLGLLDRVFFRDTSVTTSVKGLTGLTASSAGLTCYYARTGATTSTAVTLIAGAMGTWSSGGFVEIDATHMPGWYEFGIPNAAIATVASSVGFHFRGATNMEDMPHQYELDAVGYQSADFGLGSAPLPTTPVANSYGESLMMVDYMGGRFNTAQAGGASTITLDAGAASDAGAYIGDGIVLYGGTGGGVRGTGQRRTIVAYNTSTKVATVDRAWATNPDATTKFFTLPMPKADVWLWTGQPTSVDANNLPNVNVKDWNAVLVATAVPLAASAYTTPPTVAAIAAGVLTDTTSGDEAAAGSLGHLVTTAPGWYAAPPTTTAIATAIWQDATAGDFTTVSSAGHQLMAAALATQIPAHFTNTTFSADGVLAVGALVNTPVSGGLGFVIASGPTSGVITLTVPSTATVSGWVGRKLYHVQSQSEATISAATLSGTTATVTIGSGWPATVVTGTDTAVVLP